MYDPIIMSREFTEIQKVLSWKDSRFTRVSGPCSRLIVSPTEGADCVVTTSHLHLMEKIYFVAFSGPVILIFSKG
jgi:hypothetical protein